MADITELPQGWQRIRNPPGLYRKFEFAAYDETRLFLDRLADISEETGLHPNLSFGKTYANVTIATDGVGPSREEIDFAHRVNEAANGIA